MRTLILLSILNHAAFSGSRVAASLAGLQLNASPFAIGLILSFYSLLPMFLSVAGGRMVDRIGMRKPMVYGTALLAFGVGVPFIAWDIGSLYLASVTIGLGYMGFHLCMQKLSGIADTDEQRKMNFSMLALSFSVSGFIGPTGTGILIDLIGHRATFGALAVLVLIAWVGLMRYKFSKEADPQPVAATAEPPQPGNVTDLLKNPELRSLYVAVALISSAWDVHQFVVPLYGASLGLSASSIGFVLGTFAAATFVVRLVLPLVLNRVSEWAMIRLAMVTAVGVYFLYPFFPVLPVMLALSFVLGLGLGVSQPMILSSVHRVAPEGRIGEAVGLRLMLVNASQALLPTAFGAAGGVFGLAPIFWGMSAVISSGVFYTRRAGRPGQPGRPNIDKSDDEGLL